MTAAETTDLVPPANGASPAAQGSPFMPPALDVAAYMEPVPPLAPEVAEKLARPVDPALVELREQIHYVPWIHYQAVLLDAFGPMGYRMVPLSPPRVQGNVMTWRMALTVRPPGQSKFYFVKDSVGECVMHGRMTPGNAAEGAQSDALTKGCKALGIFRELFDPDWRRKWEASYKNRHLQTKAHPGALPAPSAPASRPAATPAAAGAAPTAHDSTGGAASAAPPPTPGETPPPVDQGGTTVPPNAASQDTGEAAAADDYAAVAREMKRLQWKGQYAKIWLKDFFGVEKISALTAQQCASALALLVAVTTGKKPADCPAYTAMVSALTAKGAIG